ncbi:MAG: adenylate/guanylate cyclase domain-containing protein [Magnetococcales bacterium]|nr:adenylate/guanylate cyclase domain-containing protein [Magnetococcales bacterium]
MVKHWYKRYDILVTLALFLLAIPAEYFELFSLLEDQFVSARYLLRQTYGAHQVTAPSEQIVLVNTDEAFFKQYQSFPLRRSDIGRIAANLRKLGAAVVAIDVLMDFPSSYGEDEPTAKLLQEAGNILLVSQADISGGQFRKLNYPTENLNRVARSGYTNIGSFSSIVTNLYRLKVYPEITTQRDGWPFSIQTLAMFLNVQPKVNHGVVELGDVRSIPLDQFNSFYIDFPALPKGSRFLSQVRGISAAEFLNLEGKSEEELFELGYWVKDKIVLLGDTSEVSHDWFDTPVGMVYGVEIIANTIHTLMKGGPIRPAPLSMEILVSMAFMLAIFLINYRTIHPLLRLFNFVAVITSYGLLVSLFFIHQGVLVSMSYTLLAGVLGSTVINLRSFLLERGQKNMIKGAFGQYLSPKVVDILVKDPSKLSLGGEQREMTAFFSDVAGFSTISEKLTPHELVKLLNEYLTAMCDIISRYDGTVDKFEGDAIIAFWGAPLDQPDHALLACYTSIDMQNYMVELRQRLQQEGRPVMHMRIGVNSGLMVVGNMGSKQRMDYTIMGDAVNLAARLEGANKFYSTYTMISHYTYQMVKDFVDARELDTIRVVGKKEPITIYQLLARKGQTPAPLSDILSSYNTGLDLYKAKDFESAKQQFEQVLQIVPEDGPAKTYVERCQEFLLHPPAEDWDGVYQLTSKG